MTLAGTTVWEVQTGGSDNNGGGYKSDAGTTDYSQQSAAELTVADGATAGIANTTLTSVTGGFTAQMVGSIVHLYTGTNLVDGWYEITAYSDTNTVTLDRAPDDGVGGVSAADVKIGGALATPGALGKVLNDHGVPDMRAYIKAGTYNLSSASPNVPGGTIDLSDNMTATAVLIKGYDTDRLTLGGTRPYIDCNGNTPTNGNVVELNGNNVECHTVAFLEIDGDSQTFTAGIAGNTNLYDNVIGCIVHDVTGFGITTALVRGCYVYACTGVGVNACVPTDTHVDNCGGDGFYVDAVGCSRCIASNNTGDGFQILAGTIENCTSYSNDDGFRLRRAVTAINCVSSDDSAYAFTFDADQNSNLIHCAQYSAGSGWFPGNTPLLEVGSVTLTADPFDGKAALDFRPNAAVGGGADLRAAGYDIYGQTDARDIGAVQHAGGVTFIGTRRNVMIGR